MKANLETAKNPYVAPNELKVPKATPKGELKNIKTPVLDSATKVTLSKESKPEVSVPKPSLPEVVKEIPKEKIKTEATEILKKEKKPLLQKPLIFFIKGLDISSGYGGLKEMGESVEGARVYGWDQYQEMRDEISKTDPKQPLVLVGHSLGADTAHEIAEDLDSVKGGFRKVDLLVMIDAFGADHDVISQNVKKHINVFSESGILSDGPHVARRFEKTDVQNILSPRDHSDLDDDKAIQYDILEAIQQSVKKS